MPPVFSIMYIPLLDWSADNFWQVFVKIRKGTSHRGSQWQLFFHDIPLDFFMCKTGMVSNSKNWCQYWMRESCTLAGPSSLIETITVERRHTLLHLWCRPLQSVPFLFVQGFLDLLVLNDIRVYFFEISSYFWSKNLKCLMATLSTDLHTFLRTYRLWYLILIIQQGNTN